MKQEDIRDHTERYLKIYSDLETTRNKGVLTHFRGLQQNAIQKFTGLGFPTTKNEEWKFTDVGILHDFNFQPSPELPDRRKHEEWIREHFIGAPDSWRVVFLDGHYHPGLSNTGKGSGIEITPFSALKTGRDEELASCLGRQFTSLDDPFTALNTALFHDGTWIRIPKGKIIEGPVEIVYVSTQQQQSGLIHPRNLVQVGENSQVRIIENYIGQDETVYFNNAVTEIIVESNALVEHFKVQNESNRAVHISTIQVMQNKNSNYTSHSFSFGGMLVRNNLNTVLADEGSESTLNGLYVGDGKQHIDNHTSIDHTRPHCNSHELYKGILDDSAHGVFNGKIFVRPAAQKTNAIQSNNCILLTDDATINTKPQLEIFADDVKCTHGATVGQLDEEAYFYMRSRGLDKEKARQMLIFAFAGDVIDRVALDPIREKITGLLSRKLKNIHLD
jgi:Fe-S cluster assembly protein SufD